MAYRAELVLVPDTVAEAYFAAGGTIHFITGLGNGLEYRNEFVSRDGPCGSLRHGPFATVHDAYGAFEGSAHAAIDVTDRHPANPFTTTWGRFNKLPDGSVVFLLHQDPRSQ
jgi:hypothetical protein